MFIHCELVVLILALSLHGQVHTGEIIGGREAVPHSRPYMVLLEAHLKNASKARCGGFLLTEDFVMTAAHCQKHNAVSYNIILGLHNAYNKTAVQNISVAKIYPHEDYHYNLNDIMILQLSSKAKFSRNVRPIAMADKDSHSLPTSCSVAGWGRNTINTGYMSAKLMELNVTLIDDEQCRRDICYCSKGDKGPARGDSGGPLVCGGKAYGVVSHVKEGQFCSLYSYTKILENRSWIHAVLHDHS